MKSKGSLRRRATSAGDALDVLVRPDEQCVALTSEYRLIQRYRGHRTSVDDMLVAHLAGTRGGSPGRVLDLGCGIGSVLLMVAWARPEAGFVGVEALPEHGALARRNLLLNDCDRRARIVEGDIRDEALLGGLGTFDLVLGTPPYFDPRRGTMCKDPQRAAAQWELRGGIEDYARAAAATLAPDGLFVACAAADPPDRSARAFAAAGLEVRWRRQVLPRTSKPPFLTLLVGARCAEGPTIEAPLLLLRQSDGSRTAEHIEIREWFGVPASPR